MSQYLVSVVTKTPFNKILVQVHTNSSGLKKRILPILFFLSFGLEPAVVIAADNLNKTIPKQFYSVPAGPLNQA